MSARALRGAGAGSNGATRQAPARVLITGGAGFIGSNLAHHLLDQGLQVRIFDALARAGTEENLRWLRATHPERLEIVLGDICDRRAVREAVRDVQHVFHFAAQVAVTTSLDDPQHDFAVNAGGTLNLLEAARAQEHPPSIVYASTNKVYGALADVTVLAQGARYLPDDPRIRRHGIGEARPLEFHSPYGCSKGAAEQYVLDYARTFGMRNTVLRMSCIYGPRQHGNADQGWVAHFVRSAAHGEPLTIYGDGRQVRDLLFIEDFVAAQLCILRDVDAHAGQAYNIGGGVANTVSLLELVDIVEQLQGTRLEPRFEDWREADQKYYVSDITRFSNATGWRPRVGVGAGVRALGAWLGAHVPTGESRVPLAAEPRDGFAQQGANS